MAMDKGAGYQHFFDVAPTDTKYLTDTKRVLASKNNFPEIMGVLEKYDVMSVDTETTGLSFVDDHIVCVSVAVSPYESYMFPFRHKVDAHKNLGKSQYIELWELLCTKKLLFFNAVFDLLMFDHDKALQGVGRDVSKISFFEVQALTFNADTNYTPRNLKECARIHLGRDSPEFREVVGAQASFDYLSPEEGLFYATSDALNTYGLFVKLNQYLNKECPFILKLDNELTKAFLFYTEQQVWIDKERMVSLLRDMRIKIREVEGEIFKIVGYPFNCGSNRALSQAFASLGIYTGKTTKTGDMSVSASLLEKINHPVAKLIVQRNSLATQISSYLEKLSKQDTGRIQYKLFHVPCLIGSSLLEYEGSKYRPIKDAKVGDIIKVRCGYDEIVDWKEVGVEPCLRILLANGTALAGTYHHPVMDLYGNLRELQHLHVGEEIWVKGLCTSKVTRVSRVGLHMVYDITMKKDPWFFANDILTHNTGRFASGSEKVSSTKRNDYFLPLNFQNLTKPKPMFFRSKSSDEGTSVLRPTASDGGTSVLGYYFIPEGDGVEGVLVEGTDNHINVRSAISVPELNKEDWIMVSIDYVAEELLIIGALSREPNLLGPLVSGEDIHRLNAEKMWGKEAYDKEKRRLAKIAIFGLNYGGTIYTLMQNAGLSEEQATDVFEKYWELMSTLKSWQKREISKAYRNNGVIYSAFGRPRRLKYYLANPDKKWQRFGERSVASHQVQGLAADVMRIVLTNAAKRVFIPRQDSVKFVGVVHDEILFSCKKDIVDEVVEEMRQIMKIEIPGTGVFLETSVDFGYSYGEMFPFMKSKEGLWIPKPA